MNEKDLAHFKALLLEKRQALLAKAARAKDEGRAAVAEGGEDYVDDAVTHYNREFLLSMSDMDRRTIALVQEALERIEDGTYGECLMSGDEIPRKRLEAVPWARYTARCQEMVEREEMADLPLRDFFAEEPEEASRARARAAAAAGEEEEEEEGAPRRRPPRTAAGEYDGDEHAESDEEESEFAPDEDAAAPGDTDITVEEDEDDDL
jgi:DnaK suppressor protein